MIDFIKRIHWHYVFSTALVVALIVLALIGWLFALQFATDIGMLPIDHCKEIGLDPATSNCEKYL